MIQTKRLHHRSGFTLIELLVAIAVVAILSASLFGTLTVAFKARQSAEAALDPSRRAAIAMEILQNDLENALPPNPVANATTSTNTAALYLAGNFEGKTGSSASGLRSDDLQFYAATDSPAHADGDCDVKFVELEVKAPDNPQLGSDPVLVRRVTSNLLPPTGQTPQPDEEVICRGVVGFTLRYFDGTQWYDMWDSTQANGAEPINTLPQAIEVTLTLQGPADHPDQQPQFRRVFVLSTYPQSSGSGNIGLPEGF